MNVQAGPFISTVDRIAGKVRPLSQLIDFIMSRIAPHTRAKAGCHGNAYYCGSRPGEWCYWYCGFDGSACRRYNVYHEIIKYDTTGTDCTYGTAECDDGCDYIVHTSTACSPCPA